jgi:hypothetical protein
MIDAELSSTRQAVLATLLRELPVIVTAQPPGGPAGSNSPWPASLSPFT